MKNVKFVNENAEVAIAYPNDDCTNDCNLQVTNNCLRNEIAIAWNNLHYEVVSHFWSKKQILRSLSGQCRVGTLNALMGPSGAGKTTLLRFLSGALRHELPSDSQILLRAGQKSTSFFVEQHVQQTIVGELQVGHILEYAYHFKNGLLSKRDHMQRHIEYVLEQLFLPADIVHRLFSNCSGGEQKRVAIAQELMSRKPPDFLFIDEPTTGLDSASALEVVSCLRRLRTANPNIAVIASIHSPSDEVMRLFDFVYVLARGGAAIYSGVPGDISKQLRELINYSVPRDNPPIESLIKLACENVHTDERLQKIEYHIREKESKTIAQSFNISKSSAGDRGLSNPRKFFSFGDLALEFHRSARVTFIARRHLIAFYCILFFGLLTTFSTVFSSESAEANGCVSFADDAELVTKNCTNRQKVHEDMTVQENQFYIGLVYMFTSYIVMSNSALTYVDNLKVFRSEHRNHWYSVGIFYWSSSVISFIEINFYAVFVALFSYFLGGQHAADDYAINWTRFGFYFLYLFGSVIYLQAMGHLIGVFLLNYRTMAIFACLLLYAFATQLTEFFTKIARLGNPTMITVENYFGLVYMTRGVYWSIYGLDRCETENEFSWVLIECGAEEGMRWEYLWNIVMKTIAIRVVVLIALYIRCNDFFSLNIFNILGRFQRKKILMNDREEMAFENELSNATNEEEMNDKAIDEMRRKLEPIGEEANMNESEQELSSSVLIGWRNLTLYASSSIFDTISESTKLASKVNNSKPKQVILNDLNGQLRFGTLNALMGTSGAGKTSLLRVLNGRFKSRLDDATRIYANTKQMIVTSFIEQEIDSHLISGLTAEQTLMYASWLKNGSSGSLDHREVANQALRQLQLDPIAQNPVERCSGGERKRLALGTEITNRTKAMPNLICIDEPTSGLDSNSAEIVIACLRDLAHQHGITIVASMHQPTVGILTRLLDHVYVLARGGVCIYSGAPSHIEAHLRSLPLIENEISTFPVETLIRHSCSDSRDPIVRALSDRTNQQFVKEKSDENGQLFEQTTLLVDGVIPNRPKFSAHSVYVLTHRLIRFFIVFQWKIWLLYLITFIVFGKMVTLLFDVKFIYESGCLDPESDFNNTCSKTEQDLERDMQRTDNFIYIYYYSVIFCFLILICYSLEFMRDLDNFAIEHRNGWYSTGSWYATKCALETLLSLPITFAYIYVYDIYEPIRPIYWYMVPLFLGSVLSMQAIAHTWATLANGNYVRLTVINITYFMISLLIGNSYVAIHRLHYVYRGASNFSVLRLLFEGVLILVFGFDRCRKREIQPLLAGRRLIDEDYRSSILLLAMNVIVWRVVAIVILIRRCNEIEGQRERAARIAQYRREKLQPTV